MKLADSAIRDGYRINSFETLPSTNDEAILRAQAGDRGKLWIVAGRQTGGRGRQGRSWASPPGNLYATLLLVDPAPVAILPQLGLVAGVALAETIMDCTGLEGAVTIKWPNDILVHGAKLAGILVEGVKCRDGRFACVLGFGVNCQSHPSGLAYRATDVASVSERKPTVNTIMSALSAKVDEVLRVWERGKGFEAIRGLWLACALPEGTPMSVSTQACKGDGVFQTIDHSGRLVLATPDGTTVIETGDVFLMDQPARPAG